MKEDRAIAHALVRWFADAGRDLPWRLADPTTGRRNPYLSLVSEVMLQQTQVARVLERFGAFVERFPTVGALASADEAAVLAAWSGMGYYRRARLLHRAAAEVRDRYGGAVPHDPRELASLPGVGRYTAGAVASICFGRAVPIVDGNVRRVLMRLEGRRGAQEGAAAERWVWRRAGELVDAAAALRPATPGAFNEGLMELGATVCTPRAPRCAECPLQGGCKAFRLGLAERIPRPKGAARRKTIVCATVVVSDRSGRLLVERRGDRGLWARMWQAPTLEGATEPSAEELASLIGGHGAGPVVARFEHGTTHRDVCFVVHRAKALSPRAAGRAAGAGAERRWLPPPEVAGLALSTPQRRVLLTIGAAEGRGGVL